MCQTDAWPSSTTSPRSSSTSARSRCCRRNASASASRGRWSSPMPACARPACSKALDALAGLPVAVFDQTPSNPTEAAVRAAAEMYRERLRRPDRRRRRLGHRLRQGRRDRGHARRAAQDLRHHRRRLAEITDTRRAADRRAHHRGTGSEVARGAIVIVDDGSKLGFHSWHLVPKTAICDPELTLGLPPKLTAATGMDAIAHCMETFMSAAFNPPADGIALDGLERGWAPHRARHPRRQRPRGAPQPHERLDAGRDGVPEGPGLRAFAQPQPGRRRPAPAPRHAQRHVPARGGAFQRRRRIGRKERRLQRMAHAMGLPVDARPAEPSPRRSAT